MLFVPSTVALVSFLPLIIIVIGPLVVSFVMAAIPFLTVSVSDLFYKIKI